MGSINGEMTGGTLNHLIGMIGAKIGTLQTTVAGVKLSETFIITQN